MFPGLQGGPLMRAIAGKAAGFGEALKPEFKAYMQNVLDNAVVLSETLLEDGFDIVSGGTDTHVVLVDLRPKGLTGNISEVALENAGITCNKNGVPFDPEKPWRPLVSVSEHRLQRLVAVRMNRRVGNLSVKSSTGWRVTAMTTHRLKLLFSKKYRSCAAPSQFTDLV